MEQSNVEALGLDVRLRGVVCRHGRLEAVSGVDLEVARGERIALTGTNGSGKTTLLRAVLGLHRKVDGELLVGGRGTRTAAEWAWRRRACAWIPQRPAAGRFPLLARELLASSGAHEAAAAAAGRLGVGALADRSLDSLSGGQLQRMHLARAVGCVAAGAGVVLADEPTAALDFAGQEEAAEVLTSLGATLLVVTHDRAMAERCDRVLEMAAGRLREVR
ncbi:MULTISPECIES: ABC transporter ATP-binding protein [Streptomyces]|uniref:ABC transporter n=2 Tax=Streptomyces TaxID=1883 RepID=A0A2N8PI69_STRNR|nr:MULTISPECIES: ABC transporter ATP-binding protein [Streptomyces]PNE40660.1 ABC transporter [Streptomyces noursei]SHM68298.1 ABC-type cobalamin/Fe3+-siderophores transport system, ATPase component [Streptomyces yunnanensis]